MVDKNKILYIDSAFTKTLPTATDAIDSIFIEGYASTCDIDRGGDIVPTGVWANGILNYLKNPIILAQHDYDDPIGRMVEHKIDSTGLWIKARISAAAEVFSLVKDGVLTAFSIGFRVKDAEYNSAADVFVIKELELVEISVVSVPMNQNTLFNLSKAFTSAEDYNSFKAQFIPKGTSAKGLESLKDKKSTIKKEWNMDPKELELMLANAAKAAAEQATKSLLDSQAAEKAAKEVAEKAAAELDARIKAAVALATPSSTGTDKLMAEIEKRFADQSEATKSTIDGLQAAIAEKSAEILAMQKSKMTFDTSSKDGISASEKDTAVFLSKIMGKSIEGTKYGKELLTKSGAHVGAGAITAPQSIWETEVSLNMESEVRRKLVIAPSIRSINMQTNVMKIPLNPEAGYGQWMANSSFGSAASAGNIATHALNEITLSAYKVATTEYLAYEEEEDTMLAVLPVIRDAMIRRTAKSIDKAFLMGAGAGADPVKGLSVFSAASAGLAFPSVATLLGTTGTSNLRFLRKSLGAGGLDPSDVVYIVSSEVYFALMEDPIFQTMEKVGPQATVITGQVGMIAGSPVLVSAEFPSAVSGTSTASTNLAAIAVAKSNWLVGNQRGLRFDTQELVETQRKVLVASMRTGLVQLTTNMGIGVSAMRWTT